MRAPRKNLLLLLSTILNFTATYGHLHFGTPPIYGSNLFNNRVPQQAVFANQPINDKLLDLIKENQRHQLIIQNINRRISDLNNQEPGLESLRQRRGTVGQNNEEFDESNPELVQRLREQNPGENAMKNGLNLNNNIQSILERLMQTQKNQNVVQNVGQIGANRVPDLMKLLSHHNRGQFVMQNVNRRFGTNPININHEARLEPKHLPGEQLGLHNFEINHGFNPNLEALLERLTQNNRGQFVVQQVNRRTPLSSININPDLESLARLQRESVIHNMAKGNLYMKPSLEILPVGLQPLQHHNHRTKHQQIVMQNGKQSSLNPENNYFNTLIGPLTLQHRVKAMLQSIGKNNGLSFDNIEALLTQASPDLIQSIKRQREHGKGYLNSLLELLKEHRNRDTIYNNIYSIKKGYQNNDLERITLQQQLQNEHVHGFKHIINNKNYVSLNDNKTPFDHRVDYVNRNRLLNIFIEKYIPENIKRILYNPRTREEKEKRLMLLNNYKIITFAFADFLRYSYPLAGYIKSLRIITENMKQRAKNYVVPVQFIQKEVENLSQVGVDASGIRIKKIGSNPEIFVQDLNLKVEDLLEPLEERPASNLNEGIFTVPETIAENDIKTDESGNIANLDDTRLQVSNNKIRGKVKSEALHQTSKEESAPLENVEDSTVLQSNENVAPAVIGLDHLSESEYDNNNNSHREDVTPGGHTHEPELVDDKNDDGNLAVKETQHPETETEYTRDTDLKSNVINRNKNHNVIFRPNLMISPMIDKVFCKSLDTDEAIEVMQEVLYNVVGELNKLFRLDDVILNVTKHAILKTLHDKSLYPNKRCENDPFYLRSTNK